MTDDEIARIGRLLNHADMDATDVTRLVRSFMMRVLYEVNALTARLAVVGDEADAYRILAAEKEKRIETLEREAFLAATMMREIVAERDAIKRLLACGNSFWIDNVHVEWRGNFQCPDDWSLRFDGKAPTIFITGFEQAIAKARELATKGLICERCGDPEKEKAGE